LSAWLWMDVRSGSTPQVYPLLKTISSWGYGITHNIKHVTCNDFFHHYSFIPAFVSDKVTFIWLYINHTNTLVLFLNPVYKTLAIRVVCIVLLCSLKCHSLYMLRLNECFLAFFCIGSARALNSYIRLFEVVGLYLIYHIHVH